MTARDLPGAVAAAVEMYAALITAREFLSSESNAFADCNMLADGGFLPDDAEILADYDRALLQIDAALAKAEGRA